jgi:putative ABC transport system permease protein
MGRSNVPLLREETLVTYAEKAAQRLLPGETVDVLGWDVRGGDLAVLATAAAAALACTLALYLFFRTKLGTAMRATGDNPQMIRALGVHTGNMVILGIALANGLIGLSGALLAQYQGFADVQMGIGMVIWGMASVIIGQALVRSSHLGLTLSGTIMGSILFRLLVAIALRWGLNPNDLKLITAAFVLVALVLPRFLDQIQRRRGGMRLAHG